MRITYMLWFLSGKTWRLISDGSDYDELIKDIHPHTRFEHRNYEYLLCYGEKPLSPTRIYCVTEQKGF